MHGLKELVEYQNKEIRRECELALAQKNTALAKRIRTANPQIDWAK